MHIANDWNEIIKKEHRINPTFLFQKIDEERERERKKTLGINSSRDFFPF